MSQTTENPTGAAQPTESGLERLEREFSGAPEPETTTPEEDKSQEGLVDETPKETPEVKTEIKEKKEEKEPELTEVALEFKDETKEEEEGWRSYFSEFGIDVPEDYSEERGFELFKSRLEEKYNQEKEQIKNFRLDDILQDFPEQQQAEAKLVLDLLRAGQTIDKINEPILNIQKMRSLTPEQLVRMNYENTEGWTQEMVDHKMEQLTQNNQLEVEHKILMNYLDGKEKEIKVQQQQYLQNYNTQQQALREQKRQKEAESFKAALDRETAFMDIPLKDSNKGAILQEYQNGYRERLLSDPVKLAKFMLFDKYGPQAMELIQTRANERARRELAKKQHNIPQEAAPKGGGRAVNQNSYKTGVERLEAEYNQNT